MTRNIEIIREMEIDELINQLKTALHEFWERHEMNTEWNEDILPDELRTKANAAIIGRARYDLDKKSLKDLRQLSGESLYAYSIRCSMIDQYLESAADAIQAYFDGIVYKN
jgi:hypothetical protein